MSIYLWIAFGSALGGTARFALCGLIARHVGDAFQWGTFAINVSGSFLIGFSATLAGPEGRFLASPTMRIFVMPGILGGFTTYSAFSLQTFELARSGDWLRAGANAFGTFLLCFLAVWLGYVCASALKSSAGATTSL